MNKSFCIFCALVLGLVVKKLRKNSITILISLASALATSFPGSRILPPGTSEERPWLGLVTCYFDNWEHQGGVLCNQTVRHVELCRAATAPAIVGFGLKFQIVSIQTFIQRLDKSVSRQFTLVVMLLPSYPLNVYGKSVTFQLRTSSSAILFWSDS